MALQEVTTAFLRRFRGPRGPLYQAYRLQCRQYATEPPAGEALDLEHSAFLEPDSDGVAEAKGYDAARQAKRRRRLPPSRYVGT